MHIDDSRLLVDEVVVFYLEIGVENAANPSQTHATKIHSYSESKTLIMGNSVGRCIV